MIPVTFTIPVVLGRLLGYWAADVGRGIVETSDRLMTRDDVVALTPT